MSHRKSHAIVAQQEGEMQQRLSREEFHRWAERQPARYERVCSEPVAMAPERIQHVRVKARVWAALDRAIASAGVDCEALSDGVTIEVDDDTDYEPDAIVNCGPPASPDAIAASNPVIVVEVLSPATQSIDTSDKLAGYFRLGSVQHYLVVSTRRREVVHHRRDGDAIASRIVNVGMIELAPPGIAIDIAEFYPAQR
ncbi:MAG TPA: Uma2 family endonuclease [Acetobacteraceae bacterium]|nr:Uma2 family endonuclease [Acetobacteraceae bacterium]